MAVYNVIRNWYFFVLVLIVFTTVIGALEQESNRHLEKADNHDPLLNYKIVDVSISEDRVKRSADDDDLQIAVTLDDGSLMEINLELTSGILASKDTPVWEAEGIFEFKTKKNTVKYSRNYKALSAVGPVSFYQNYAERAAVAVFHDYELMEGIVRHYEFRQNSTKRESSRNKFSKGQQLTPEVKSSSTSNKDTATSGKLRPNGKPDVVYPELLVILDQNYTRNGTLGTPEALMKTFAYWNSVDMLFSNLKSPKIKLNIAGIIVPTNYFAAPWIQLTDPFGNNGYIDVEAALDAFGDYFLNDESQFPNDGYDFVINLVSKKLNDAKGQNNIAGVSYLDASCDKRKYRVGIINYTSDNATATGAREIGRLLSAPYDDDTEKCKTADGIMAKSMRSKPASLSWSRCSQDAFSNYFSQEKSVCLDNCPKTVHNCEENVKPKVPTSGSDTPVNDATSVSNSMNDKTAKASTSDACSVHKKDVENMKLILFYVLSISLYFCKVSISTEL